MQSIKLTLSHHRKTQRLIRLRVSTFNYFNPFTRFKLISWMLNDNNNRVTLQTTLSFYFMLCRGFTCDCYYIFITITTVTLWGEASPNKSSQSYFLYYLDWQTCFKIIPAIPGFNRNACKYRFHFYMHLVKAVRSCICYALSAYSRYFKLIYLYRLTIHSLCKY